MYTPSMKNEPWAKLTMRVTPKISDSPAATRNSDDAPASPLSSWTMKAENVIDQSAGRSFFTSASVGWNLAPSKYT
jgi:hypothetical protein